MSEALPVFKTTRTVSLELTSACNLDCGFCPEGLITRKHGMMDLELAKRLVREVRETRFCDTIVTNVMGEPLLYRGLYDLLESAHSVGQRMTVLTNGERLDEPTSKRLLEARPYAVSISFNANDEESYAYKKAHIPWEEYQRRVRRFVELKFSMGSETHVTIYSLSTVNQQHDKYKVLPSLESIRQYKAAWIDFAEDLKQKYAIDYAVPRDIYGGTTLLPGFHCHILYDSHFWANTILPSNVNVVPSKSFSCMAPFEQINILWNGDLVLCCIDYDGELVYGNIKDVSLFEAYNSAKLNEVRKSFLTNDRIPKKCSVCTGGLMNADGTEYGPRRIYPDTSYSTYLQRGLLEVRRLAQAGDLLQTLRRRVFASSTVNEWRRSYLRWRFGSLALGPGDEPVLKGRSL